MLATDIDDFLTHEWSWTLVFCKVGIDYVLVEFCHNAAIQVKISRFNQNTVPSQLLSSSTYSKQPISWNNTFFTFQTFTLNPNYLYQKDERVLLNSLT